MAKPNTLATIDVMLNLFKRHKERSEGIKIINVIPIDWYELLIVLENGRIRSFEPAKYNLYDEYNFLAYPQKLRSFSINSDQINWTYGITFNSEFLIQHSVELETEKLKWKNLSIGSKNQAPTTEDQKHHVYDVAIRPFNSEMPIILSESIGGGLGDRGGSRNIRIEEVKEYRDHFALSDCLWAYELIANLDNDLREVMNALISEFIKRNYK